MKKTLLSSFWVLSAFVLNSFSSAGAAGQTIDRARSNAILTDPQRDAEHPSWNEAVWIPSGGVLMNFIGHSYGGFVTARVAATHPTISGAVLIAPWSPAEDIPQFRVPEARFAAVAHSVFDDVEGRA